MLDNLNPIFSQPSKNEDKLQLETKISENKTLKKRKTRSDKGHHVKFPVSIDQLISFKTSLERFKFHYPHIEIMQTKYNTLLLSYALDNIKIVDWDLEYIGTSDYHMTTKLPEHRYQEIGGVHGLAINRGLSARKTVYKMTISSLNYIEKGGYYGEIFQQIRPIKK